MRDIKHANCQECLNAVLGTPTKAQIGLFNRTGRIYCSRECSKAWAARRSSETMAATNRKYASARMTARNPMRHADVREKVKTSLRAMGWKPPVRRGNGTGPTAPQLALASSLGWPMEVAVPTKIKQSARTHPTCYKLDIANPTLKIGIEVDGNSHYSRKAQDAKKDALLRSLGWTVLRFSNKEVTERLAGCVQTVLSTISKSKESTPTPPTA